MPDVMPDDSLSIPFPRPEEFTRSLRYTSVNAPEPQRNIYAWAAMPIIDDWQNDITSQQAQTFQAPPSDQAPRRSASPSEDTSRKTFNGPAPSIPAQAGEPRFDDLIPQALAVMRSPSLGYVTLRYPRDYSATNDYGLGNTEQDFRPAPHRVPFDLLPANPVVSAPDRSQFRAPIDSPFDDTNYDSRSARTRYAATILNSAVTNNATIDRNTEMLLTVLAATVHEMGEGSGPVFGTNVHRNFAARVRALDLPGIEVHLIEESWIKGFFADYGDEGSIRTDVVLSTATKHPLAIYDLKTGNARLTPRRVIELRAAVGDPNVPVIELRYRDGTATLR